MKENIVLKIKSLLIEKRLTYDELAAKIGMSRSTVANYLSMRTNFDVEILEIISKALDTNISTFFTENAYDKESIAPNSETFQVLKTSLQYDSVLIDMIYNSILTKEKITASNIQYMEMLLGKYGNFPVDKLQGLVALDLISSSTIDKIQELKQARTKYPELF